MAETEFLVAPKAVPDLGIPASSSTVKVYVIDTTTRLSQTPVGKIVVPQTGHHTEFRGPSFSFLIVHGQRHVLFDLGVRKDRENLPPNIQQRMVDFPFDVKVDKDVATLLDEHAATTGVRRNDIEAVIWSHHHWDHTGNVSIFPASTDLLLGPGLKKQYFPGYPTNPEGTVSDSDLEGRNVREVEYTTGLKIAGLEACDFFGDGSFYLLDSPGHSKGHICGLARTTSDPPSFVLMGGDACHHCGEIRPSPYLPLPRTIKPSPLSRFSQAGCPGAMFEQIQANRRADERFYDPKETFSFDHEAALRTLRVLEQFDAHESVLFIMSHDGSLLGGKIDLFPHTINDWRAKDAARKTKWAFLVDFEQEKELEQ